MGKARTANKAPSDFDLLGRNVCRWWQLLVQIGSRRRREGYHLIDRRSVFELQLMQRRRVICRCKEES